MASTPPALPGRLQRWKLTEPVRLYLALPIAAQLALAVMLLTVDVPAIAKVAGFAVILALVAGVAAARASVFSPAGAMQDRINAATRARSIH